MILSIHLPAYLFIPEYYDNKTKLIVFTLGNLRFT